MRMMAIAVSMLLSILADKPNTTSPVIVGTEVQILPSTKAESYLLLKRATPYTYSCTAAVIEAAADGKPENRAVVGHLILLPGETDTVTNRADGYVFVFDATIDNGTDRAIWKLTITRDTGELVSRQQSTVWLQRSSIR